MYLVKKTDFQLIKVILIMIMVIINIRIVIVMVMAIMMVIMLRNIVIMITMIDNNEYSNYSTYIHEIFSGCSSYFAIFF